MLETVQIPVMDDNYIYLIHEAETGATAVIDPALSEPVLAEADKRGWKITHIFNTHHHYDHVDGNLEIQKATGATIVGAANDAKRIPGIQVRVKDGDEYEFGSLKLQVFEVPGHTVGHIAYWIKSEDVLFCGDTLFALGCGRMFEGTAPQMWESLSKLRDLPDATKVYCAHEYTEANAAFAVTIDPSNLALSQRVDKIHDLRKQNIPTIPTTIGEEKETNPFFRADDAAVIAHLGMQGQDVASIFGEIRKRKDNF